MLLLPLRFPLLLLLSGGYSGLLYATGLRAGLSDVRDPYWVLTVGAVLLLSPAYHAILLPAICAALDGRRADWRVALRGVADVFPGLFLGQLAVGAGVIAGGLLFLIPGIYVGMRLIYYKQVIVCERQTAIAALRQSLRLTQDWRGTVGLFVGLATLYGAAVGLDSLLVGGAPPAVVHGGAVVGTALVLTWMNAWVTARYAVETRARSAEPL